MNIRILYEDVQIIVAVKPPGVATQTKKISEQDMESWLKNHLGAQDGGTYVGVIHRLDQPVEGILVFAKNSAAAKELGRQVQDGRMGKYYLAAVSSCPAQPEGILEDYLQKDGRTNTSRVVDPALKTAKKSILQYEVVQQAQDCCYIRISLKTGRHHQIRVQCAHHGFPLLGDRKYNPGYSAGTTAVGLALCAYRLEFLHPATKKKMGFEIRPSAKYFDSLV